METCEFIIASFWNFAYFFWCPFAVFFQGEYHLARFYHYPVQVFGDLTTTARWQKTKKNCLREEKSAWIRKGPRFALILRTSLNKLCSEYTLQGMETYPTLGSSENHRLKMPFFEDMLVPWRVSFFQASGQISYISPTWISLKWDKFPLPKPPFGVKTRVFRCYNLTKNIHDLQMRNSFCLMSAPG